MPNKIRDWAKEHPYITAGGAAAGTVGLGLLARAATKRWPAPKVVNKAAKGAKKAIQSGGKAAKGAAKAKKPRPISNVEDFRKARHSRKLDIFSTLPKDTKGPPNKAEQKELLKRFGRKVGRKAPPSTGPKKKGPPKSEWESIWSRHKKESSVQFCSFAHELMNIKLSGTALLRDMNDTLDRRTIRKHRKPNPRLLPAPLESGRIPK